MDAAAYLVAWLVLVEASDRALVVVEWLRMELAIGNHRARSEPKVRKEDHPVSVDRAKPSKGSGWSRYPLPASMPPTIAMWRSVDGLLATSECVLAEAPDGRGDLIVQHHVAVSRKWVRGRMLSALEARAMRPTNAEIAATLQVFGFEEFEIDNHSPGAAVHCWIPIDPARRVECQCKTSELVLVEPDGYAWTTPVDGPCQGCVQARTLILAGNIHLPCTRHPEGPR